MPDPVSLLTVLVDRQATGTADPLPTPFPVARTTGEGSPDRRLHLVDGDGASLCELFAQQQLERLPMPWCDVVTGARCRTCELLGS
ncbi:hypothetical protein ACI8AC_10050 [Geodermatophilus sp. SYSU D00758]